MINGVVEALPEHKVELCSQQVECTELHVPEIRQILICIRRVSTQDQNIAPVLRTPVGQEVILTTVKRASAKHQEGAPRLIGHGCRARIAFHGKTVVRCVGLQACQQIIRAHGKNNIVVVRIFFPGIKRRYHNDKNHQHVQRSESGRPPDKPGQNILRQGNCGKDKKQGNERRRPVQAD